MTNRNATWPVRRSHINWVCTGVRVWGATLSPETVRWGQSYAQLKPQPNTAPAQNRKTHITCHHHQQPNHPNPHTPNSPPIMYTLRHTHRRCCRRSRRRRRPRRRSPTLYFSPFLSLSLSHTLTHSLRISFYAIHPIRLH